MDLLSTGEIEIEGQLVDASNLALRVRVGTGDTRAAAVYKPIRGERELWDFPDGHLAGREVATFLIARAGGWPHIPETVLRDGPLGPGSLQRWVGPLEPQEPISLIRLDPVREVPPSYLPVVALELEGDGPVAVSHADDPRLASLAVLDAVLNNADRKGSHLIEDDRRLWAIDHGITLHTDPKLRTVLWGWAGDPIPEDDLGRLHDLVAALDDTLASELAPLLTGDEVEALRHRAHRLLRQGTFPEPPEARTPLPWPLW
ncbi:hypothetical protein VV01_07695 [Luteipulveratus halotolerans]|uniref:Phosphatidylinositol kinase n=1 Tax=Luteipulveratus halotolerans TaxID=1631356 RepID=A0A0L6CP28_9MICO|nr:hypothetical protein VV01_07695 [Luteipulveratus halotolerans]